MVSIMAGSHFQLFATAHISMRQSETSKDNDDSDYIGHSFSIHRVCKSLGAIVFEKEGGGCFIHPPLANQKCQIKSAARVRDDVLPRPVGSVPFPSTWLSSLAIDPPGAMLVQETALPSGVVYLL